MRRNPSSADAGTPRRGNLGLLVRTLRAHGPGSRARLAARSGLSKATVSSLVAELGRRGLVGSAGIDASGQGRPGELVALRPGAVFGIGMDIHATHVGATAVDLSGRVRFRRQVACDVAALPPDEAIDALAGVAARVGREIAARGGLVSGYTVAAPGLVDAGAGAVRLAHRLRWRDVQVLDGLAARTGVPVARFALDNDANLAAIAEHAARPVPDLVYLAGDHGVGAGLVSGGVLVRGALGRAGEVGHMALDPLGPYCACGRRGCWETQVGLDALLRACADPADPIRDPALPTADRLARLRERAERGDRRTLDGLHQVGGALGIGLSIVVNLLNPAVVVLGGWFAALPEWLVEPIRVQIAAHAHTDTDVVPTRAGAGAPATGGALAALDRVVDDPTVIPTRRGPAGGNEEAPA